MSDPSRRDFLKLLRAGFLYLSGAFAIGGLLRFLDFDPNPAPQTNFDLGPADNFPPDSRTLLADPPAVLLHTPSGFSAISLVCTHLGCTVEQSAGGFTCPCHGSLYDANGKVTRGPAQSPLRKLRVEVTADNHILLHTD